LLLFYNRILLRSMSNVTFNFNHLYPGIYLILLRIYNKKRKE